MEECEGVCARCVERDGRKSTSGSSLRDEEASGNNSESRRESCVHEAMLKV